MSYIVINAPIAQGNDMQPGEALYPDQSIRSANGRFRFIYQYDGNLVLYGPTGPLWASGTDGRPTGVCLMQGDGNLVIYDSNGGYIWDTKTYQNPGSRLLVQDDGNVVIYAPNYMPLWNLYLHKHVGLKVLCFNLWMAQEKIQIDGTTISNDYRLLKIAEFLRNHNPDVAFLTEIDKYTERSRLGDGTKVNQADWLAKATSLKYYVFGKYSDHQGGEVGSAILSRFPFSKTLSHGLLFGSSFPEVEIIIQGVPFRIITAHFNYLYPKWRQEAAKHVIYNIIKPGDGDKPIIFGGDLNLKPFTNSEDSASVEILQGKLSDSFYKAPFQYRRGENTCSGGQGAPDLEHAVDYIFFRGPFKVKSWCAPCSTDNRHEPKKGQCGGPDYPYLTDHTRPRVELLYGGNWSEWESFDGPNKAYLLSSPAVSGWLSGNRWDLVRFDVFVKGPGDFLYRKSFDSNKWSSDWEPFMDRKVTSDPAAISWGEGRIDVFARGQNDSLVHKWYDSNGWPYGWSQWESLEGILTSGPAVCSRAKGRLDVFVKGTDNRIYWKFYGPHPFPALKPPFWRTWTDLGNEELTSDPAAVCWSEGQVNSWSDGRIDVFARGRDYSLMHKWYNSSGWSHWESLGGTLASAPTVSSWGAGRLDIFARSKDNRLMHKWWDGNWSDWHFSKLGGQISEIYPNPDAISLGSGRIDVFSTGADYRLHHKWFI